eukprot:1824292-Pyramimonas_sp.AAC.1
MHSNSGSSAEPSRKRRPPSSPSAGLFTHMTAIAPGLQAVCGGCGSQHLEKHSPASSPRCLTRVAQRRRRADT